MQAFVAAALAGIGNGGLNPSQSTLLAALASPDVRHRVTAVSRVASNAGIGLGSALGGLVAGFGLNGFILLFLANAVTYLIYVFVLVAVVRKEVKPEPIAGGYRLVLRDQAFMHLALTNIAIIGVGWGVFTWLVPPYAKEQIGLSTQLIGLLLLANAITVVVAQVPVAKFAEGRRRAVMMAFAAFIFVIACLLVVAAGFRLDLAYPVLITASMLVAVGECFHTTVLMPLVADLAPVSLRGRYMAAIGLSWWVGLALAPTLGTPALSISPRLAFLVAASVSAVAALSALALERRLPDEARLTPHPQGRSAAATESAD
jgi:MFS family permease